MEAIIIKIMEINKIIIPFKKTIKNNYLKMQNNLKNNIKMIMKSKIRKIVNR